ncbi:MAG: class II fructose-1,6-bisphosphate aldolase [Bacilli bacterium]|nr:class II fructose-1,6-bisphosphate aldolase [Bacilli bacterium]
MLVNMRKMLNDALINHYCVPHFNINNLEWTRFILEAADSVHSPLIIGVSEGAVKYMGGYTVVSSIVKSLIKELDIKIPVALHLDHGSSYDSCKEAVKAGFSSVMIDASMHDFEDNIYITKKVVNYCKHYNISVEAEVGHVGGTEDGKEKSILYTTTSEAVKFVNATGIDFLAPALGSVHGLYKGEPKLNFETMKEISESLNIPLVLHGGTGIDDEKIRKAISCGICKLNINTELQIVWSNAVRKFLDQDKSVYDPRKIIKSGEAALKEAVIAKIKLLGSENRS